MANQYTYYSSTDSSAPSMNPNTAGSLITVLNAVLVTGYGTQPAAGWTSPFTGTNKAVYRAPSGVQHYLLVDDSAPSGSYPIAVVNGYETMSSISVGTGEFPALSTSGLCKGITTANPAAWFAFADSRSFMFFAQNSNSAQGWLGFYFGEIYSVQSNDSYRTLIRYFIQSGSSDGMSKLSTSISSATAQANMPRGYTGLGSMISVSCTGDGAKSNSATTLSGIVPLPNPEEGGLYLSPVWISDPTTSPANNIRGRMRGFWHTLHANTSINHLQQFTGIGDLAGRTFVAIKPAGDSLGVGTFMVEISATLETN